jgi:hypothetical protein
MRNLLLLVLLFGFIKSISAQTEVTLKIEKLKIDSVEYYLSKQSKYVYPFWGWNKANVDSDGNVKLKLNNNELNFLLINVRNDKFYKPIRLFIKPNEKYFIKVNPKSETVLEINGKFKDGQLAYTETRRYMLCGGFDKDYIDDSIPSKLSETLEWNINNELKPFIELLNEDKIDNEFYSLVKTDIECFNAYLLLTTIQSRHEYTYGTYTGCALPKEVQDIDATLPEFISFIDTLFKKYSFNSSEVWLISQLDGYIGNYIWYKSLVDKSFNSIEDEYKKNLLIAKKYLHTEFYEYYYATKFNLLTDVETMKERLEAFKQEFPKSNYITGIEKNIEMAQEFLNKGFKL